ncbi:dihydrolipoamide acetyltransferase component of pyruvate dehydrogenase complex [Thermogymnomonas acidicola]|uniref:Dihydrolipoamide acetyltransferase component of pyruvate dehydrogenase complex n=1 Tax=Thermogymnomonas acidicola TaxID=399579 RepID=A0AA37BQ10_9ARCH|nr:dihydrolipoamide acetyltransferase family protein [Thermogymnomonas acidicola]GGM68684.1 dihydrolipoamide acetyltransferase component of pyruvate dehydrogenase complex [Thermogymnomonas acidicola]
MYEFRLPDIGEGVSEGEIVKWHVREGDRIRKDQDMVEVMTDKVTVKIPSPIEGVVKSIKYPEGSVVKVGTVLIEISTEGEVASPKPAEAKEAREVPVQVQRPAGATRVLASPAVRRIARERGIDLTVIKGSGPNGRVTLDDLRAAESARATRSETAKVSTQMVTAEEDQILEIRGLRRLIFEKMSKAKSEMPHFMVSERFDVTHLKAIIDDLGKRGSRVTYTSMFIKAVSVALRDYPYLNAIYDEANRRYLLKKRYNIGMAVDTEQGLTVAVVKDADRKSIMQIASEVRDLAERARKGQLTLEEVQGSTFTVSNVGSIGGLFSTPIINYPEVAILAMHRAFQEGERFFMYCSLSCDHRLIDGAMATRFLIRLKELIENPYLFMVV